ncbi:MAG: PQQ-binding-like beta-propeller repeat protein [Pseudomonadota bacterium]|nr:PQQ-binding-like beta-propeller repeat protein [Pseudomonadota bacterium]
MALSSSMPLGIYKWVFRVFFTAMLVTGCGGGSGTGSSAGAGSSPATGANNPTTTTAGSGGNTCSKSVSNTAASTVWPGDRWQTAVPETSGMCPDGIQEALDYAFAEGNDTGAVLIIKNGAIVAEQYASDRSSTSLVTSWSVAKSITSALVGSALETGAIKGLAEPLGNYFASWADTPKSAITVDQLLTVKTGLELLGDEDNNGIPDGGDLYAAADQLGLSLSRSLTGNPGEQTYIYSNSDVMLAGELVHLATGQSAAEYWNNGIANEIGITSEWWTDQSNQVMSYCCLDATPRDFARFGLLYARQGAWRDKQVLGADWINHSTQPARFGTYGYYWWPAANGGYAALGVMGQLVAIYPEQDLVVLRFSRYERRGDGSTVRSGANYHDTKEPENFSNDVFLNHVFNALEPQPSSAAGGSPPTTSITPNQVAAVGSMVSVLAAQSQDPEGRPLTYHWRLLEKPKASEAIISGLGKTAGFTPDMPGDYVLELSVSDGNLSSDPIQTTVTVTNSRDVVAEGTTQGQWPVYAGNNASMKYSPLDQISAKNIADLDVAWRWRSPDNDIEGVQNTAFEATPLFIDGVLYTSTSFSQVAAIEAKSGNTLWQFDPETYRYARPPNNGYLHRGVSYHESAVGKTIHMPTGDGRLIALNAINGEPRAGFGDSGFGSVDLLDDIPRLNLSTMQLSDAHDQPDAPDFAGIVSQIGNSSPGVMCNDTLILGSSVHDGEVLPPSPPGDVRGFDPTSGKLLWTFHTVPRDGEFGIDTWEQDSWKVNGNTNVWPPMSADESLGLVYLPTGAPTNNYYGGQRLGDNLFANSVVALDCQTGQRRWHFQTVHHDIWDYDLPAAPNLIDIVIAGEPIKAVAQVSKQGFLFVFDRITGEPIWPIVETAVPASTVPGERVAPTQPIPSWPPPFVRQGSSVEALIDPYSADGYDTGPLYTPPTTKGLIITPGEGGGANWGGAAFDPTTQLLYVAGFGPLTHLVRLENGGSDDFYFARPELFFGPTTGSPYPGNGSAITAYDMNSGSILWQVPGAEDPSVIGNAAVVISGDLLIYKNSSLQTLNFFDKRDGTLLRSVPLGGRPTGSPMTYLDGDRQYIIVAVGRQDELMEIVALALPE